MHISRIIWDIKTMWALAALFAVCYFPFAFLLLRLSACSLPFAVQRATFDVHRSPFDVFGPLRWTLTAPRLLDDVLGGGPASRLGGWKLKAKAICESVRKLHSVARCALFYAHNGNFSVAFAQLSKQLSCFYSRPVEGASTFSFLKPLPPLKNEKEKAQHIGSKRAWQHMKRHWERAGHLLEIVAVRGNPWTFRESALLCTVMLGLSNPVETSELWLCQIVN